MKKRFRWGLALVVLLGLGAAGFSSARAYFKPTAATRFRTNPAKMGTIVAVVNSTGTVQPVLNVQVGSFVSGPVVELNVDFNSVVKKGDLLARIDPRIYKANVDRDTATLNHAKADVDRVTALLQQARNDEQRSRKLRETNPDYISDSEMDQYRFNRQSLEAQLQLAEAQVKQAAAALSLSSANVEYTQIEAPCDGIVVDRKIDPGQTVAAQFQTPVFFIIGVDLDKRVYVLASVDEAEIGQVKAAQQRDQPVRFSVDAYPEDLFEGKIAQVRMNSTTTQNVVTYTVVVEAANADLKLLPGMTASISFQVAEHANVLRIPNAALRFYPRPEQVRLEDRALLEGAAYEKAEDNQRDPDIVRRSATEKVEASRSRSQRHVWVIDGNWLRAVAVTTGLSDNQFTEVLAGDIGEGQEFVIGDRVPGYGS